MLIPSWDSTYPTGKTSLSRRVNANSQRIISLNLRNTKLIKKGEC